MPDDPSPAPTASRFVKLRNAFITGALLLAPLWVTVWAFTKIIAVLGGTFRPLYESYLPDSLQRIPFFWDLLATIVVLLLITLLGYLSHHFFGKFFMGLIERFVQNIPGIGAIYNSVKQIVATFGSERRNLFNKVVLVQFPRAGAWSVGVLTNKTQGEPQARAGAEMWTVFVPTTPNPTSGFLIIVPRHEVVELELSVGDGMKMILSGGAVMPPWPAVESPKEEGRNRK
jgi:uncharacterized membrane protein